MYYLRILPIVLLLSFNSFAQDNYSKQQLLQILANPSNDTTLLNAYNELCWPIYSYDLPDSSIYYGNKAIEFATKINDIKRLSIAHRRLGITYTNKGDVISSIKHQKLSYELAEKINFKRGMQLSLNNLGVAYSNNQIYTKALGYFLQSLKLIEETKNYASVEHVYYNCALIYSHINDFSKSKEYIFKAIRISEQNRDSMSLVIFYSYLSTISRNLKKMDSAFYYLQKAGNYISKENRLSSQFSYYLNEGLLYAEKGDHQKALDKFLATKPYATIAGDEITLLINIAEQYQVLKKQEQSLDYFKQAFDLSEKTKTYNNLMYVSHEMAGIYKSQKNYERYTKFIDLYLNYRDSNDKYLKVQQILQQQLEFDYERKQVADSLRFEHLEKLKDKEIEIADERLKKERTFRVMLLLGLISIVFFSVIIFNRLKLSRKQNEIIEKQKQLVESKNHEMLDSINYAKRLQIAILPQLNDIKKTLPLDILYLPKDIIGGDFYFFENYGDHTFFAVCDCTGHGVPGALMSVVCHNALHKAITEFKVTEPGAILTKTREIVIDSLNARQQNIRDGMDCTLIVLNQKTKQVTWAGANNHLWFVHNSQLTEVKADKQPVSFYENEKEFTTQKLEVPAGAYVYLLTDGYGDQFGGPKGKKYKNSALKEFLLRIQNEKEAKQIERLQENILAWKGELDQVDDITVAVIRF